MFLFERESLKRPGPTAFAQAREVRFQDVDAAGVIFYPRLLEYFNDAFLDFLSQAARPLHLSLGKEPWLSPVRHAEADFLRPLRFGDRIAVGIVSARCMPAESPSEVTLGFRVTRHGSGEVTAFGQVVHTFVDATSFQRCPMPREALELYARLSGP